MSRFTQIWQKLNTGVEKGAGLPYNALVEVAGKQYRVGNYDSVHDEYSLVTVENGKTVIRKFPAAQVEAAKMQKDSVEDEFRHVYQGEDDAHANEHHLEEAKKSPGYDGDVPITTKSSRVYGEKRLTEDEAFADLKELVDQNEGHVLQAYVDYDQDDGVHYACVTLGNRAVVKKVGEGGYHTEEISLMQAASQLLSGGNSKDEVVKMLARQYPDIDLADIKTLVNRSVNKSQIAKTYKVGDRVMHKGRKYEVTAVRKDGKYTLKPTADSKGKDGTWIEEKEIFGYAKDMQKSGIEPYGQSYNAGGLLKTGTEEYEVDPTHATNVNNMDPGLIANEEDYTVAPTYAMVNDEATKKSMEQIKEQLVALEKELYRTSTFDRAGRQELLAKHAELSAQLNISENNATVAKSTAVKTAIEFRNPKVPSFKEIFRAGTVEKSMSPTQMAEAVGEIFERLDVGGYGWEQKAVTWLQGKGFSMAEVKWIIDQVKSDL